MFKAVKRELILFIHAHTGHIARLESKSSLVKFHRDIFLRYLVSDTKFLKYLVEVFEAVVLVINTSYFTRNLVEIPAIKEQMKAIKTRAHLVGGVPVCLW